MNKNEKQGEVNKGREKRKPRPGLKGQVRREERIEDKREDKKEGRRG